MMLILSQSTSLAVPVLMQLGVGGIFVLMVLREVANVLEKSRSKRNGAGAPLVLPSDVLRQLNKHQEVCIETNNLMGNVYEWLKPNADGEQTWKNKQLIDIIRELKEESARGNRAIENNNRLLDRLLPIVARAEAKGA